MARGNLAARGLAARSRIVLRDYREAKLQGEGQTLFIGNPPYVRHHLIAPKWKDWLTARASELDLESSQLAGLHVHFFLATVLAARAGDYGALVTAAEWLDVNYGKLVRDLFLGKLGGHGIVVVEPTATPFPDTATTAAITFFRVASRPASVRLRRVKQLRELKDLSGGRLVRRERLENESRWSRLIMRPASAQRALSSSENSVAFTAARSLGAQIESGSPASTHASSLSVSSIAASPRPASSSRPDGCSRTRANCARSLTCLRTSRSSAVRSARLFTDLRIAKKDGAHSGYIASHRRAWWSVGLRSPAPILATYMARRPPAFTRNLASARHINIAHGLYPRESLTEAQLLALVDYLSSNISVMDGRTYAGGLTKFEPGEMERLFVPRPEHLAAQELRGRC